MTGARRRRPGRVTALLLGAAVLAAVARVATASAADPAPGVGPRCLPVRVGATADLRSRPGRLITLPVEGHSVLVYVPGATDAMPRFRVPVVYFLHGAPGAATQWIAQGHLPALLDTLITHDQLPPLIAVFPDEQGRAPGDSWWGNTALGDTIETWLMNDLVPAIDDRYCTLGPQYRGIAGLSAGGFGALNLAFHENGLFSWAAGYSGVYTAPSGIFGPKVPENSPQRWAATVPPSERFPLFLGGGADDRLYRSETDHMIATVEALHWSPLRVEIVPGAHTWQAWSAEARDSLLWLGDLWKDDLELPVLGKV